MSKKSSYIYIYCAFPAAPAKNCLPACNDYNNNIPTAEGVRRNGLIAHGTYYTMVYVCYYLFHY